MIVMEVAGSHSVTFRNYNVPILCRNMPFQYHFVTQHPHSRHHSVQCEQLVQFRTLNQYCITSRVIRII